MPPPDIVAIGEPLFELNQPKGEDIFRPGHGGDTSNCAIAAARQGVSVAYVTAVGADQFGDSFMKLWADEGIDTSAVKRSQTAHTGLYFVTHGPDGHVFSYMRAGSAASRMTPDDMPVEMIKAAQRPACLRHQPGDLVERRRRRVHGDADRTRGGRARLLRHQSSPPPVAARPRPRGDPCRRDPRRHPSARARRCACTSPASPIPIAIVDFYLSLGPKIVALTLGSDGALVATKERRERFAAVPVKLVDATGAGDMFDGAFLAEYLRTGDPFAAGRYANVAAALSTEGYGAVAPMPRRAAVEAALKAGARD